LAIPVVGRRPQTASGAGDTRQLVRWGNNRRRTCGIKCKRKRKGGTQQDREENGGQRGCRQLSPKPNTNPQWRAECPMRSNRDLSGCHRLLAGGLPRTGRQAWLQQGRTRPKGQSHRSCTPHTRRLRRGILDEGASIAGGFIGWEGQQAEGKGPGDGSARSRFQGCRNWCPARRR
jgi:hypothetical protein